MDVHVSHYVRHHLEPGTIVTTGAKQKTSAGSILMLDFIIGISANT